MFRRVSTMLFPRIFLDVSQGDTSPPPMVKPGNSAIVTSFCAEAATFLPLEAVSSPRGHRESRSAGGFNRVSDGFFGGFDRGKLPSEMVIGRGQ